LGFEIYLNFGAWDLGFIDPLTPLYDFHLLRRNN
jgi:hypothetical protein